MTNDMKLMEVLFNKIEERRMATVDALVKGAAADFAAYQNIVGQVRGLAAAQMEINDLLRKLKEADDDN